MESFILTRSAVQVQVFGTGYPSLPSMTVNEWYEQHCKEEQLYDLGVMTNAPAEICTNLMQRQREIKSDDDEDQDDDDDMSPLRARSWDDWKDTHPEGYGNRQNMG